MSLRLKFPKKRIAAFVVDWVIWLYLSYCVFFLINHWYRNLVFVSPAYRVPFPPYAWGVVILSTFFLAMLWENLGTSAGLKAFGLTILAEDGSPLTRGLRARRFWIDLFSFLLTLAAGGLLLFPLAGLGTLFWGISTRTGIWIVPGVRLWAIGPWPLCLGYLVASLVILGGIGAGCFFIAYWVVRWLWSCPEDDLPWCDRILRTRVVAASEIKTVLPQERWFKTSWGLMTLLLVLATFYVGWLITDISFENLIRRAPTTAYLWKWLATPDFKHFITPEPVLQDSIGSALVETVFMALMATVFGVIFAFPLSFLGARNIMGFSPVGWLIYSITRGFFNIVRSVETIVWAVIFAVWVKFGPFAGVLALAAHTVAALGKLYSEQVESIDPGPLEAIAAAGARRWQVILYGVIPQIIPSYLAFTLYRWDINVRMSTIIGLVGGGGIGRILFYYKNEIRWHEVGAVIIVIIAVVWLMDYASGLVRERIV